MPQLSKSVQLTHLRIAVTSEEAITLTGSDAPGTAPPGQGKGKLVEPILDKLSALIAAMNDKYGSDLGEADKVWVEDQGPSCRPHEKIGVLFDMFFANPDFQNALVRHLAGTYDEFRTEAAG